MEQMRQNEAGALTAQAIPQKDVEQACFHALGLIGRNCEYLDQHLAHVGADQQTRQAVNDISAASARLDRTVNEVMSLLDFLRTEEDPRLYPLDLCQLLQQVADGDVTPDDAALRLKMQPFQEIGAYAKVDFHRGIRQGVPEVIFGEGKAKEHILGIAREMLRSGQRTILITRLSAEAAAYLETDLPLHYDSAARVGIIGELPPPGGKGRIVVATGGTSDIPVAEEAALTAEALGNAVTRLYDVGVSGLHRLLANLDTIMSARVIVAVAGMEGALPSVIGGLADCPVIAVPTSIGYGASLGGIAALLSMLNSCASGMSVVNIDNGFGAGYLASMINHLD